MSTLLKLPTDLTRSRGLNLIMGAGKARNDILELIASLLLQCPLFVIAGDDWLPGVELARTVHKNTSDAKRVLNGLYTIRTSTCHELFDALASRRSNGEAILVLDFLHPFCDVDVPLAIRLSRLSQCCREFQRLAFYRPVTVITADTRCVENYEDFSSALNSIADKIFLLETEHTLIQQPALF